MIHLRNLAASAALLMFAGFGVASAQQAGTDHGAMGHGGMSQGGMGQGGMSGMMEHGGGAGHGGMMGGGDQHAMMRKMMCGVSEHVDGRLAYLKAELKLTDQQQAAWNSFADAFRAAAQKTGQFCASITDEHGGHEGVIDHLAKMESHMTAHLESVRSVKAAIEPLFKVLTDEQKKTANEALTSVMKVGMHMGGGMGGMSH
jgi:hypothetical protein